jgi:putative transposase
VAWVEGAYQVSERRACRATGVGRSLITYRSRRPSQDALRQRLRELAQARVSFGYLRLHTLLVREGWKINHKRVYRLYREEGLGLKRQKPRRRRSAVAREGKREAQQPNQRWAMDFMQDALADGRKIRVLTIVDVFTRECLSLEVRGRFGGPEVVEVLQGLVTERGKPEIIQCDQGTEFTSKIVDQWAWEQKIQLDFSRRGKPGDNARNEAFNGSVRRECLSQHYFLNLGDARKVLERWKEEYNTDRPHGSLGRICPVQFRAQWTKTQGSNELENSRS